MDTVTILRALRRQRTLVGLAAIWALLAGFTVAYRITSGLELESRKYEVAVATARILVDTPSSQVVRVAPKGSDALGVRATLLSNIMVEGVIKVAIAQRAGLSPEQFTGFAETASQPAVETPARRRDYQLTTRVLSNPSGDQLPIIEIEAETPDSRSAVKLANAAISGLQDHLDSRAADENVSAAQRLRVTGLGSAQARQEVRGPGLIMTFAAMLLAFGIGCAAIFALPALIGMWRASAQEDEPSDDGADFALDGLFDQDEAFGPGTPEQAGRAVPAREVRAEAT